MSARSKPGSYAEVKARLLTCRSPWKTEALQILEIVCISNQNDHKRSMNSSALAGASEDRIQPKMRSGTLAMMPIWKMANTAWIG